MKKQYYSGYVTCGLHGELPYEQNSDNLKVGKLYLTEEYEQWESHNGNGGSTYSSLSTYVKVYTLKTKKLVATQINPCVFKDSIAKNCKHINRARIIRTSKIERCHDCFKKIKSFIVLKEI